MQLSIGGDFWVRDWCTCPLSPFCSRTPTSADPFKPCWGTDGLIRHNTQLASHFVKPSNYWSHTRGTLTKWMLPAGHQPGCLIVYTKSCVDDIDGLIYLPQFTYLLPFFHLSINVPVILLFVYYLPSHLIYFPAHSSVLETMAYN